MNDLTPATDNTNLSLEKGPKEEVVEFEERIFKLLDEALVSGAATYQYLKLEAEGGPEPANVQNSLGAAEKRQIKRSSRHPYGHSIVQTYCNGLSVSTIIDSQLQTSPFYQWYRENQMDKKMTMLNMDSFIGGSGYLELYIDPKDGKMKANVASPNTTAILNINRANDEFAVYAIQKLRNSGQDLYKVWDSKYEYTFKKGKGNKKNKWEQDRRIVHGFPMCPVISFDDLVSSDGTVKSTIEILQPVLETLRQVTASTSNAAYWQGNKQMIVTNVDRSQTVYNKETGETSSMHDIVEEELHNPSDNGYIILPHNSTIGAAQPTVLQLNEANIAQLTDVVKQVKLTLTSLASLPAHRYDPEATPQTSEASTQSHIPLNMLLRSKKISINDRMFSIYRIWCEMNGYEIDWDTRIVWASDGTTSMNALSDTVAKLRAAGLPLQWIINEIVAPGFDPDSVKNLTQSLEDEKATSPNFEDMFGEVAQ
jgi:hypothetical protein